MDEARAATPLVGISMGDPAGIGPEVIVKALSKLSDAQPCRVIVYGDARVMEKAAAFWAPGLKVREARPADCRAGDSLQPSAGFLPVLDLANADPASFQPGRVQALCGKASWEYLRAASVAALAGEIDGLDTAPVNKEALGAAGIPYIGHTEMLAALTGAHDPLTMFETGKLRIFFLSRHVSLREAIDLVSEGRVLDYIRRCSQALACLGVEGGTLAVAALNPHSGERGRFGDEEDRIIRPAIERARADGLAVDGPVGADSVFHLALQGRYAAVLSLYHDQGHVAAKTLDFDGTVALTLGLPFVRVSVDHGTAFDIAWKGRADSRGMEASLQAAARYSPSWGRRFP